MISDEGYSNLYMNKENLSSILFFVILFGCCGGTVVLDTLVFKDSVGIAICGASLTAISFLAWYLISDNKKD